MKQDNNKPNDPDLGSRKSSSKSVLDSYQMFYEALEFKPSFSSRLLPRLQRPSKTRG